MRAPLWALAMLAATLAAPVRAHAAGEAAESALRAPHAERASERREPADAFADRLMHVLLLTDYNTRVVALGTMLLGASSGVVGTLALLRRRALVGDVVGHSSLSGIAVAFLIALRFAPSASRHLSTLLAGAAVSGVLAVMLTVVLPRWTRIKDDAAQAIVLAVNFGLGIALFTVIQRVPAGNAAGLNQFIFGKAALMVAGDVVLIAVASAAALLVCLALFKELALVCFDSGFASSQGWPAPLLDVTLMGLVVGITVIALQSVGLLLVTALLVTPPASARFWTNRLGRMTLLAALFGALSAWLGVMASALVPRLAAGGVIVLSGALVFTISLLFGSRRGLLRRKIDEVRLRRRVGRHDLLRALYECAEAGGRALSTVELAARSVPRETLAAQRAWNPRALGRLLRAAEGEELVAESAPGQWRFTLAGAQEARAVVRNHRLWELYLIRHADVAAARVDHVADRIEHVLEPEVIAELESLLDEGDQAAAVPASPHPMRGDDDRGSDA